MAISTPSVPIRLPAGWSWNGKDPMRANGTTSGVPARLLLLVFLLIFQVPFTLFMLWVPVIYLVELVAVLGLALICSMLNVYFRDVQYLVTSVLTVMFWLSPVFYSLTNAHQNMPKLMYGIYILNPLAGIIDSTRKTIIEQTHPDAVAMGVATLVSFVLLAIGIVLFERYSRNFSDRI